MLNPIGVAAVVAPADAGAFLFDDLSPK